MTNYRKRKRTRIIATSASAMIVLGATSVLFPHFSVVYADTIPNITVYGDTLDLSMAELGTDFLGAVKASDFTVSVDSVGDSVNSANFAGMSVNFWTSQTEYSDVILTLSSAVVSGETVSISYTGDDLEYDSNDCGDNVEFPNFTDEPAVNNSPPSLSDATIRPGQSIGTTQVVASVPAGDTLVYTIGSSSTSEPEGGTPPSASPYTSGEDISASPGQYLDVYEVNGSNQVQAWSEYQLTSADIDAVQGVGISTDKTTVTSDETVSVAGTVYDVYHNPVSGAQVDLTSTDGNGGAIGSWQSPYATTDSDGNYTDKWTAPTVSTQTSVTVTATVYGLSQSSTITVNPVNSGGPVPPFINTVGFTEDAQVGVPYSKQLIATGGSQPYTWSVASGSLPAGLTLDAQTGEIAGTPTGQAGPYTFTVQVTDANHLSMTRQLTLTVDGAMTPSITPGTLLPGKVGQSYMQTLAATGGTEPYAWSVADGALPAGLSLDAKTGVISGMPTKGGVVNLTVEVTDADGQTATQPMIVDILQSYERAVVWNGKVQNVPGIVGNDGGTETTYMPIWYVMQLLKEGGIDSTWNGHEWNLTTSATPDLTGIAAGSGNASIYLNGTLVQQVNTEAQDDPSTKKPTTYMPIWYVEQILNRVGLQSSWDGTTWTVRQTNS